MRLDKTNNDILNYQLVYAMIDKYLEHEIVFNNSTLGKETITHDKFIALTKRLSNLKDDKGHKYLLSSKDKEELDISIKGQYLRCTLNRKEDIIDFCKDRVLKKDYNYIILFKDRHQWTSPINDKIGKFTYFTDRDYNFRSNLKVEYDCTTKISEFVRQHSLVKKQKKDLLTAPKFINLLKFFRFKKRYSYVSRDKLFRIDITIVKSSKKYSKNFHESGTLENDNEYEIEIEYIGDQIHRKENLIDDDNNIILTSEFQNVKKSLFRNIGCVLQILQNSFYVISKRETRLVIDIFHNFIKKTLFDRLITKQNYLISICEKTSIEDIDSVIDKCPLCIKDFNNVLKLRTTKIPDILRKYRNELKNVEELIRKLKKNNYSRKIGPKPVTLEINNLDVSNSVNIININSDFGKNGTLYTVTDKAEGDGNLLYTLGTKHLSKDYLDFISKNFYRGKTHEPEQFKQILDKITGNLYMIDGNNNVIFTGCKLNKELTNTLLNGEYMRSDNKNRLISHYLAYDIYSDKGIDVSELPFMISNKCLKTDVETPSRLNHLHKFINNISENGVIDKKVFFRCSVKNFYLANKDDKSIFKLSSHLWNKYKSGMINYKLDGMIYTPANYPVGYSPIIVKSDTDLKINNYDINIGKTWEYNLKWKPAEDNSIDFLIKFQKNDDSKDKIISQYGIDGKSKNYKIAHLYCGGYVYSNICFPENKTIKQYRAKRFIPISPYDNTAFIAYLEIKDGDKTNTRDLWNNMIIEDDTIVEFSYGHFDETKLDFKKENFLRWIPLRTRHDKTQSYKYSSKDKNNKINIIRNFLFEKKFLILYLNFFVKNIDKIFLNDIRKLSSSDIREIMRFFDEIKEIIQDILELDSKNGSDSKILDKLKNIIQILADENLFEIIKKYEFKCRKESSKDHFHFNKKLSQFKKIITIRSLRYSVNSSDGLYSFDLINSRNWLKDVLLSLIHKNNSKFLLNLNNINVRIPFGNDFKTANSNWRNIHNPITEYMITTGEGIISKEEYYSNTDLVSIRNQSPSINLRKFHNFVKDLLLENIVNLLDISKINLLELACGKAQDLHKWRRHGIANVVGIDINEDNIENQVNGACARFINCQEKYDNCGNIDFLVGDISKNILNGNAFDNSNKGLIYKRAFDKLWFKNSLKFSEKKFHIVSIQFAIHYLFKNKDCIDNLIKNIDENLVEGGYLIGTCFDGKKIWNELKNFKKYDSLSDFDKNNNVLWKLIKKYDNIKNKDRTEFPNDEKSLNHLIQVYISSIKKAHNEYLVNLDYLTIELKKKNIKILESPDEDKLLNMDNKGEFSDIFKKYLESPKIGKHLKKMRKSDKQFSFMNRYFIFKKYKKLDDDTIINSISEEIISSESSEKDFVQNLMSAKKQNKKSVKILEIKIIKKLKERNIPEDKYSVFISRILEELFGHVHIEDSKVDETKVYECLEEMKKFFEEYEKFLKGRQDWEMLHEQMKRTSSHTIEECFNIIKDYRDELFKLDMFNLEIFQKYWKEYSNKLFYNNIETGNVQENKKLISKQQQQKSMILLSECSNDFMDKYGTEDYNYKNTLFNKYLVRNKTNIKIYSKILNLLKHDIDDISSSYLDINYKFITHGNFKNELEKWEQNVKSFRGTIPKKSSKKKIKTDKSKKTKKTKPDTKKLKIGKKKKIKKKLKISKSSFQTGGSSNKTSIFNSMSDESDICTNMINYDEFYVSTMKKLRKFVQQYKNYKKYKNISLDNLEMVKNVKKTMKYMIFLDKIIKNKIIISNELLDFDEIHHFIYEYNDLRAEIKKHLQSDN